MIHDFAGATKLKINVYLRSGKAHSKNYLGKDIPSEPFGDNHRIVSFWHEGQLMIYPMEMVDHCILYEG